MLRTLTLNYVFVGWIYDIITCKTLFAKAVYAHSSGAAREALEQARARAMKAKEAAQGACAIM